MKFGRTLATCVTALIGGAAPAAMAAPLRIPNTQLELLEFKDLDGWDRDDHAHAFAAFRESCRVIARRTETARSRQPARPTQPIDDALRRICPRALELGQSIDASTARHFFELYFRPARISRLGEKEGFLTGYYEPEVEGSRTPGDGFTFPIYRRPAELAVRPPTARKIKQAAAHSVARKRAKVGTRKGVRLVAYHDRAAIDDGALAGRDLEICWVKDPVEAFFIHIQGSARIRLTNGKLLRLNYAAQNGHPYLAVGRVLIERGIVPQDEMTMDKIRTFIAEDPDQGRELMRMNRSYVFFREMEELPPDAEPVGAQGIPLTRGRSIAVDKSIHAYGTPFWIEAELPLERENGATPFRRLVFAQDTGGAIVGPARADIYFGAGIDAGTVAGRLRHFGRVFMLVPRPPEPRLAAVPLPLPRPKR
jgi:membrane-bound lytic murein transglycosylase A